MAAVPNKPRVIFSMHMRGGWGVFRHHRELAADETFWKPDGGYKATVLGGGYVNFHNRIHSAAQSHNIDEKCLHAFSDTAKSIPQAEHCIFQVFEDEYQVVKIVTCLALS